MAVGSTAPCVPVTKMTSVPQEQTRHTRRGSAKPRVCPRPARAGVQAAVPPPSLPSRRTEGFPPAPQEAETRPPGRLLLASGEGATDARARRLPPLGPWGIHTPTGRERHHCRRPGTVAVQTNARPLLSMRRHSPGARRPRCRLRVRPRRRELPLRSGAPRCPSLGDWLLSPSRTSSSLGHAAARAGTPFLFEAESHSTVRLGRMCVSPLPDAGF